MATVAAKPVLITGANRGIGLAFTKHYISRGWKVVASARSIDTTDEVRSLCVHSFSSFVCGGGRRCDASTGDGKLITVCACTLG